jgi:hypothetical protein
VITTNHVARVHFVELNATVELDDEPAATPTEPAQPGKPAAGGAGNATGGVSALPDTGVGPVASADRPLAALGLLVVALGVALGGAVRRHRGRAGADGPA